MAGFDPGCLVSGGVLSLYVHVPFCRLKCPYCDFFSVPAASSLDLERVIAETTEQLACFKDWLRPAQVPTVYIGGGTPSLLPAQLLKKLLCAVRDFIPKSCGEQVEWSVEANPESLDEPFLRTCLESGANRLSLGIQTMRDELLRGLGRPGDAAANRKALRLVASRWEGRLSLDLLAGIPGQTMAAMREDLDRAMEARPGHISFYALTPPPGSSLESRIDSQRRDGVWLAGFRRLEQSGYRNYEISNFARSGEECRHNLRYWNLRPYLGVGPGAVSTLPGRGARVYRLFNPERLDRFLAGRNAAWNLRLARISGRSFVFETLMMGLRLNEGLERGAFIRRFGLPLENLVPGLWPEWNARGLTAEIGGRYALNRKGRLSLDRLLIELAEHLEKTASCRTLFFE